MHKKKIMEVMAKLKSRVEERNHPSDEYNWGWDNGLEYAIRLLEESLGRRMKLKFRAWNRDKQLMLNVIAINFELLQITADIETDKIYPEASYWWKTTAIPFSEIVLMQSTGLKDKNGVEVFEGDIVHWKDCESTDDEMVYENTFVIYWSDEFLIWRAKNKGNDIDLYDISDNRELEIIGNIYENPEFLEVQGELY